MILSYQTHLRDNLYKCKAVRQLGLFLACILICLPASAQPSLGGRTLALGQAATALSAGAWAIFANPAVLPGQERQVSFYGIRNYGISELTDMAAAGALPLGPRAGTLGVGLHSYGFELYRESRFRLGYSNSYAGLQLGLAPGLTHVSIQDYGSAAAFTLDIGLAYELIDEVLRFGARATNLNRGRMGQAREELPRALAAGLSYRLASRGLLTGEVFKDVRFPLSYRGGLEVRLYQQLYMRGGLSTEPLTYALGMGYRTGWVSINLAAQQHYVLGWSPGLDIGLHW